MKDALYFLQGYSRLFLWNFLPFLLRCKIRDEFLFRTGAASECVANRGCYACGCAAPAVMMANKACSAPIYGKKKRGRKPSYAACYPTMGEYKPLHRMSDNWETTEFHFPPEQKIVKGKSYFATFKQKSNKAIKNIHPGCSCTAADMEGGNLIIRLHYSKLGLNPIPKDIVRPVLIEYADETRETLTLFAHGG